MTTFTITAAYTNPNYIGRRTELYYGKAASAKQAQTKAEKQMESLKAMNGGSFTDYQVVYGN